MFCTEKKVTLITKGPANMPKHGIAPLEGVIETDWLPYPFTINWKMTAKNVRVRFERGEPIAQIIPYPSDLITSMEPEIRLLASNPELQAEVRRLPQRSEPSSTRSLNTTPPSGKNTTSAARTLSVTSIPNTITDWKTKPFVSKTDDASEINLPPLSGSFPSMSSNSLTETRQRQQQQQRNT